LLLHHDRIFGQAVQGKNIERPAVGQLIGYAGVGRQNERAGAFILLGMNFLLWL